MLEQLDSRVQLSSKVHLRQSVFMKVLLLLTSLLLTSFVFAQERPQETAPAPSPERQREIRDSIRAKGRVKFLNEAESIKYEADRALLMPKMEHTSIFRIGIPGWLMRMSLRAGKDDFDTDEEYLAVRHVSKGIRSLRVAAFVDNPAYSSDKLLDEYERFIKRKKGEAVMYIRAPEGGVQIHVKERRGKIKLITLMAYGDEGAAVLRLKSKFSEKHLKEALELMKDTAEDTGGVVIDTDI